MTTGSSISHSERLSRARAARTMLEQLSDDDLTAEHDPAVGWGTTDRVTVGGVQIFVKRIPMTAIELASGGSTANLYGIPPYLNYPFGSPGLGAARELQFALKATRWVESAACTGFPMLLHHRVVEHGGRADGTSATGGYTAYRGDEPSMNRYLADRDQSHFDLVLCFEDLPSTASDWITSHPHDAPWIVEDVHDTIRFLQSHGVVHFDVDLFNVLTDGHRTYLGDFGLVVDPEFELDDAERDFLDAHRHFDHGNLILGLGHQLVWMFRSLPDERRHVIETELGTQGASFETVATQLLDSYRDLDDRALLQLGPPMRASLAEHDAVIRFMHEFFATSRSNWSRETMFDDAGLVELLRGTSPR